MKALSIKQPWASLIVHGIKDIENRTWKTNFRGRIYVHASAKPDPLKFNALTKTQRFDAETSPNSFDPLYFDDLPVSSIIGEVDIVDCVINHSSIWAEKMEVDVCPNTGVQILRKGQKYIWNWVLANPVRYEKPIPAKGKLSFWEPDPQTLELINMKAL